MRFKKLLEDKKQYQSLIETIDKIFENNPEEFFNELIKDKCIIYHSPFDDLFYLYKPKSFRLIYKHENHIGIEIDSEGVYQLYAVDVEEDWRLSWLHISRIDYFTINETISSFYDNCTFVDEKEFWNKLNGITNIDIDELKKFELLDKGIKPLNKYEN